MKINKPYNNKKRLCIVTNMIDDVTTLTKFRDEGYTWSDGEKIIPNPQYFRRNNIPYAIYLRVEKKIFASSVLDLE